MKRLTFFVAVVFAVLPLLAPTPVSAEWFADLYGGAAFTSNHDVDIDFRDLGATLTAKDVKFDTTGLIGGRGGYWFESLAFLGVGLDVSHVFGPNISAQTVTGCVSGFGCAGGLQLEKLKLNVTEIGFDVLLRYGFLKSPEFPKGQLQPYLTVGPAVFIAHAKDTSNFFPENQSDTDTRLGVKVGAGLAWQFHKNIAAFGEYRFTHFDPRFQFNDEFGGRVRVSTDVDTHALIGGVSFRFP